TTTTIPTLRQWLRGGDDVWTRERPSLATLRPVCPDTARLMKVSIVGCNELATTIAQKLADADWPGQALLVDPEPGTAEGRALDLLQANPVLKTQTQIRGSRNVAEIEGSNYVLIAQMGESSDAANKFFLSLGGLDRNAVILPTTNEPERLMAAARAARCA